MSDKEQLHALMLHNDARRAEQPWPADASVEMARIGAASDEVREQLAAYAHTAWAGWMQYLFRFGTLNDDGTFTIDADKVARWRRQMDTPYAHLSEAEQASDRKEADAIITGSP